MTANETIDGLQEIIDRNQKTILPRVHIGYLIHAVKYLKEQKEEIENLKQTAQSSICLLKPEPVEPILDSFLHKRCPACGALLQGQYCHECGQLVKWK